MLMFPWVSRWTYAFNTQRLAVALQRLFVVAVHTVDDTERMPADEAGQAVAQTELGEAEPLFFLVQRSKHQPFQR